MIEISRGWDIPILHHLAGKEDLIDHGIKKQKASQKLARFALSGGWPA
jgi:hypothetical protein